MKLSFIVSNDAEAKAKISCDRFIDVITKNCENTVIAKWRDLYNNFKFWNSSLIPTSTESQNVSCCFFLSKTMVLLIPAVIAMGQELWMPQIKVVNLSPTVLLFDSLMLPIAIDEGWGCIDLSRTPSVPAPQRPWLRIERSSRLFFDVIRLASSQPHPSLLLFFQDVNTEFLGADDIPKIVQLSLSDICLKSSFDSHLLKSRLAISRIIPADS